MTMIMPGLPGGPVTDRRARPLTKPERRAVIATTIAVGLIGVIGFANSFARVATAAHPSFGLMSPTVPLGIDLSIAAFSAIDIVLARLDMRPRWVRVIPWGLTAVTIYLNVAGQPSWFDRVAHGVFPALWVIAVEIGAHVIRTRAGLAAGTRMDRIRISRWLLAPVRTASLWRRMILWEIRSYPSALARERARVLALTGLQDAYGHLAWRWKAPRRDRALYRLGELVPAEDEREGAPGEHPGSTAEGAHGNALVRAHGGAPVRTPQLLSEGAHQQFPSAPATVPGVPIGAGSTVTGDRAQMNGAHPVGADHGAHEPADETALVSAPETAHGGAHEPADELRTEVRMEVRTNRPRRAATRRTNRPTATIRDAENEFMLELAAGELPSQRQIMSRLHVGPDRAKILLAHLENLSQSRSTP